LCACTTAKPTTVDPTNKNQTSYKLLFCARKRAGGRRVKSFLFPRLVRVFLFQALTCVMPSFRAPHRRRRTLASRLLRAAENNRRGETEFFGPQVRVAGCAVAVVRPAWAGVFSSSAPRNRQLTTRPVEFL
jgi:hypothetical protein